MIPQKPRQIVCAANRKNGTIICGARHFDSIMRDLVKKLGEDFIGWEQGFIDQNGVFLTREEAFQIALAANQILDYELKERGERKYLISEICIEL